MYSELKDIRRLRKHHNLTQAELAKISGVSQSLIAKIEAGTLDPTFSRAKKILGVLESLHRQVELQAKDVMVPKLIPCDPTNSVAEAVATMHKHGISQLPVVAEGHLVGLVSEGTVLEMIAKPTKDISSVRVEDVMQDIPPVVSENTQVGVITSLLRHFPIVVVTRKGGLVGVVTKADVLKVFSE